MVTMYPTVLRRILLPLHSAAKRRHYAAHRRFLEKSQWWSPERLRDFQWTELRKLLKVAFETPYYARKYAAVGATSGDITSWDDFNRLPILSRNEVRQHLEELSPPSLTSKRLPHSTGGSSSGDPVHFYRTIESYDWRLAATHRAYEWSGFAPGENSLHLWATPIGDPVGIAAAKMALFNALYRKTVISTFSRNPELWARAYSVWIAKKPRYVVGYASSLSEFARYLVQKKLRVPTPLGVLSAAEQLDDKVRTFISDVFGAPIFNTYGCREFMSVAAECDRHQGMHINAENVIVQTLIDDAVRASDVLVTDLHNHGTLFIRYALGDLGIAARGPCECGRGLPMLTAIEGRSVDNLTLGEDRSVSSLLFRHIFKDIPEILEYQVRQPARNEVVVLAVLIRPLGANSRQIFDGEMRRALGDAKFSLQPVHALSSGTTGKVKVVVPLDTIPEKDLSVVSVG